MFGVKSEIGKKCSRSQIGFNEQKMKVEPAVCQGRQILSFRDL